MNIKFYLTSLLLLFVGFFLGFYISRDLGYQLMLKFLGNPAGEGVITFLVIGSFLLLVGSAVGLLTALMIIERLGRRWGSQLNFGSHPVLKLTFLSFLTFLALLVLLLFLLPSTP